MYHALAARAMIYSNPEFFILLLATLAAYSAVPSHRWRLAVLLAASLVFYAWAGLFDTLIFALVILLSWIVVALSEAFPSAKRWLIPAGIAIATAHLFFWKYFSWLVGQAQELWPAFWGGRTIYLPLPLGISFFTLQSIAYLVDYSRAEAPAVSLPFFVLFKGFFAQLIAGPIVRANELFPQLRRLERPKASNVTMGLLLFTIGFIKKVGIADRVAFYVDSVFSAPGYFGRIVLLKAILGYSVQIWADFSGYVDMGRGAALLFGITLPENFLSPYLSRSPSEFWRRWHITLSEWIRDYLYIPLGGSRGSLPRKIAVVIVTMALSGFWHGANWTFMFWGLYHGLLLVLDRKVRLPRPASSSALYGLSELARSAGTFGLIMAGWLIFRAQNLRVLWRCLKALALDRGSHASGPGSYSLYGAIAFCLAYQIVTYYDLERKRWVFLDPLREAAAARLAWLLADDSASSAAFGLCLGSALGGLLFLAIALRTQHSAPFIYFQF